MRLDLVAIALPLLCVATPPFPQFGPASAIPEGIPVENPASLEPAYRVLEMESAPEVGGTKEKRFWDRFSAQTKDHFQASTAYEKQLAKDIKAMERNRLGRRLLVRPFRPQPLHSTFSVADFCNPRRPSDKLPRRPVDRHDTFHLVPRPRERSSAPSRRLSFRLPRPLAPAPSSILLLLSRCQRSSLAPPLAPAAPSLPAPHLVRARRLPASPARDQHPSLPPLPQSIPETLLSDSTTEPTRFVESI